MTEDVSPVTVAVAEPGVLRVQIDAPPVNALGPVVRSGLLAATARAGGTDVKVVVLTGNQRCFSAGGDLREFASVTDETGSRAVHAGYLELYQEWRGIPVPTIAAVRGYALGGALELALSCDLRIAADDAWFQASAVHMGLVESAHSLPSVVGAPFAAEMLFSARRVGAAEAAEHCLVNRVSDDLDADVDLLAAAIAAHPRAALVATKTTLAVSGYPGRQEALPHATSLWRQLRTGADHRTALADQRRSPHS